MRFALLVGLSLLATTSAPAAEPVSFRAEVSAVLSRTGCNSGPCHGNLNGKGGLRLSLRGEDAAFDHLALTRDMLARRVDAHRPDESLILKKATGQVPHEGGARFSMTSVEYVALRRWIESGATLDAESAATKLTRLDVTPTKQILIAPADHVTLSATAHFADGSKRDVTPLLAYETNNIGVATVKPTGEVVKEQDGEVVVLVRYLNRMQPVRIAFLPDRPVPDFSKLDLRHPIDRAAFDQFRELRLTPSELSSDSVFLRRAFLDALGTTPTAAEVRRFLASRDADKRAKLIDDLLDRPEFATFWAQKWSDLLRNDEKSLDKKGVQVYFRWLKGWIADDRPLTDLAREVLSARGSTYENPPTNFYRAVRDPYQRAESAAQVFLGLRVSCAKCHNHPFDVWTQDDYHRFVAVFARIDYRVLSNTRKDDLDKHEFNGEQIVVAKPTGDLPHPKGGIAEPKFLGATTPPLRDHDDRLGAFAAWVADPANPFFAKAQANRVWLHLTGRGLVDPNDDFRASNPPSNPALLDHLTTTFAANGYRLKPLVRHIMTSRTYQLSSHPTESNATDDTHHSHARVQPLEAEQLLDAVSRVLDVPVRFPGYPLGTRVNDIPAPPQTGRRATETMGTRFLKVFGKPDRLLTCECERSEDAGMLQAFMLLTGELLHDMLRDPKNRLGTMLERGASVDAMLDDLYLSALARFPTDEERSRLTRYVSAAKDRRAAWEDIAWGLVNAKEFLLRR